MFSPNSSEEQPGPGPAPRPPSPPYTIREINTRLIIVDYVNDRSKGCIQYSKHQIHNLADGEKDCLFEEILTDGVPVGLKIRVLNRPEIPFNPLTVPYYRTVNRFELSCPVSSVWVFDWIASLTVLKYLRFGHGFFNDCKEGAPKKKFERSPSVKELAITFDKKEFDEYEKEKQKRVKNKLDNVLDLCAANLTGLEIVDLTLPIGPTLDLFLTKLPKIRNLGEKVESYPNGVVSFKSVGKQRKLSTEKRPCPGKAKPKVVPPKKVKTEPNATVVGPPQASPTDDIVVVDLSGDEDQANETETTPPYTGNLDSNNGKRNGRGSPSLI